MNSTSSRQRMLLSIGLVVTLAGCGHIRTGAPDFAKSQSMANVQGMVVFDEAYSPWGMNGLNDRVAGVGPGERVYRRVVVQIIHSEGGRPMGNYKGSRRFEAVVPDGMPLMRSGDQVDARALEWYDFLKDFAKTGEGAAVLRMTCPSYGNNPPLVLISCASTLNWYQPWGEEKRYMDGVNAAPSDHPFKSSLKEYKSLKYSPYYDSEGNTLPNAVPMAARPDPSTWVRPKAPD